jgi:conjugative transfer signal peptidase TraF
MRLLLDAFRPWALVAVCGIQICCLLAGGFFALFALFAHVGVAVLFSLLFFVIAVLLTAVIRWLVQPYTPSRRFRTIAAVIVVAWIGTSLTLQAMHFRLNTSGSVPVGLYRETSDNAAAYTGFCLSLEQLRAVRRAGLELGAGECPGGVSPLLKPLVEASPMHPVTFTEHGFVIDGKLLPNTAAQSESRTHAPLSHIPFGTYTAGLWAISSYNRDSYDSRYLGPLDPSAIRFHVTPFLTH